ncbi:MAG: aminotransferase class V-fold PLP-dependent enzyme [Lachnospiraceae bacterium]|nr:aminotransferase class V-fold PLP-dependent enzyme [Lachnospiraceae bacterium]
MIYFDNAATTRTKPKDVLEAYEFYLSEIGVSPGRGSYSLGIEASRMLYKSRMILAEYFGVEEPNVVFTKNSTEAINLFLRGFLKADDHVVISPYEHNAVLRPLESMCEEGIIEYSVIDRDDLNSDSYFLMDKYFRDNTVLLGLTLASNLTGRIIYNSNLFSAAKERGVKTFVDASQGAGKIRVDMIADNIDFLAFTAHKDLKGLPGVGGLCSIDKLEFAPLIQGGTGVLGHEKINPKVYPEGYEAGTLNMPAIWALKTAVEYVESHFEANIEKGNNLTEYLLTQLEGVKNVIIYDAEYERVDTVAFNVRGYSSNEVVQALDKSGICTRGGIHCAILAHEALGTTNIGMVRVSLSENNTFDEIDNLVDILKEMSEN